MLDQIPMVAEQPQWLQIASSIVGMISTLVVGTISGTVIGSRWRAKQEKGKAGQEEARADSMGLQNVNEVINLYKKALADFQANKERDEASYLAKIEDYEKRLAEYDVRLKTYSDDLKSKDEIISNLTKSQLKLKLEIDSMKRSSTENCDQCAFKATCEKYKAKLINKNE